MKREKGSPCVECGKRVEVGQIVVVWDGEEGHFDCGRPFHVPATDDWVHQDAPPPQLLVGDPMVYLSVGRLGSLPSRSSQDRIALHRRIGAAFKRAFG